MRSLFHGGEFAQKIFFTLLAILLVYVIFLVGTLIRNNLEKFYYIGQADRLEKTITVDAEGKITAKPDIAMTTLGMVTSAATVAEAQAKNTETMNQLIAKVKGLGIEDADIQTTNYNIYPQYDYTDEGRNLRGYEVNQNVTVKIRNLDNANAVLALAGELGVNSVSGLTFTIDDKDVYLNQAREMALQKIQAKAMALSRSLGVRMVDIASYDEFEPGSDPSLYAYKEYGSVGGTAPSVESGSMDVILRVSVSFEIR